MENQTPFDLNKAVQNWRETLAQSPAFQCENLDELESHLRDSIATLQTRDLSTEEAFMVAVKRIGKRGALEQEFGKVNGSAVWLDRFLWMLLGLQAWCVLLSISSFACNILSPLGEGLKSLLNFGAQKMATGVIRDFVTIIFGPLPIAIVLALVLRRLTRKKKGIVILAQKSLNRPWMLAGGLFVTCAVLRIIAILAMRYWYIPLITNVTTGVQWSVAPQTFFYIPQYLILAGATLLIARRRLRAAME